MLSWKILTNINNHKFSPRGIVVTKTKLLKKQYIKPKNDELLIIPTKKLLKWYKQEKGVKKVW